MDFKIALNGSIAVSCVKHLKCQPLYIISGSSDYEDLFDEGDYSTPPCKKIYSTNVNAWNNLKLLIQGFVVSCLEL